MSALGLESGIVDESRLFAGDGFACFHYDFSLVTFFLRTLYPIMTQEFETIPNFLLEFFLSQIIQIMKDR